MFDTLLIADVPPGALVALFGLWLMALAAWGWMTSTAPAAARPVRSAEPSRTKRPDVPTGPRSLSDVVEGRVEFLIPHGHDLGAVRLGAMAAAESSSIILRTPPARLLFVDTGESGTRFALHFWADRRDADAAAADLRLALYETLVARRLVIPFDTLVQHQTCAA